MRQAIKSAGIWLTVPVLVGWMTAVYAFLVVPQHPLDRRKRRPVVSSFQQRVGLFSRLHYSPPPPPPLSLLSMTPTDAKESEAKESEAKEQALRWKAEAERIRLEAEKMDVALTLRKIQDLESKLVDRKRLERHPEEQAQLEEQMRSLQRRLAGEQIASVSSVKRDKPSTPLTVTNDEDGNQTTASTSPVVRQGSESSLGSTSLASTSTSASDTTKKKKPKLPEPTPLSGYDDEDLALYLPVATEIESRLSNCTLKEQVEAFRTAPELQEHFKKKIQSLLFGPLEDMQKIEELKRKYLSSSSMVEKNQFKREIDQLERTMEDGGPFAFSDSIFLDLPPMSEEEMQQRVQALQDLPAILRYLYKQRVGAKPFDADLELAILLDHYGLQLQMLDQIELLGQSFTSEMKEEVRQSVESLPVSVRNHLAKDLDLANGGDNVEALVEKLLPSKDEGDRSWGSLKSLLRSAVSSEESSPSASRPLQLPEYDDIEFIDRSRYMEEFFPSIARMEGLHPRMEDVDSFVSQVLSKKTFRVSSKPERVLGGYYIRGENCLPDDESGIKMVQQLEERLASSPLKDKIQFFYIPDPSPIADEAVEMGYDKQPLLLVTNNNSTDLYKHYASPITKATVSLLGIVSILLFSLLTCELQPALQAGLESGSEMDISWLTSVAASTALSSLLIHLSHEAAHRFVAWRNGMDVGFSSLVPSVQLGLTGTITPLRSPPPTLRSLFDFAIAGPLVGMAVAFGIFFTGLLLTASMDPSAASLLPGLPVFMLKSSALGGGLIEYILGKGAITSAASNDLVFSLHPFAIAGFTGLLANALALLPFGNTDGGRIAVAMFGRSGAFIVNSFSALLLCLGGLFGFDEARLLLIYILFTIIWQREQETPVRNEVEELDFARGALGIAAGLVVILALVPMQF